jgi:N-acylneuraminate cytidylyltransferase
MPAVEICEYQPATKAIRILVSQHIDTIAIIPARGGSKGIPRKNITDLAGKPLIAYSILAAVHARLIDRVIVSTEDEEIAAVAEDWGAEVPFLRPAEMAQDTSGIGEALTYTVTRLGGYRESRAFVFLYPTSPFRSPKFIDEMLRILYKGYSSVTTVKKALVDPHFLFVKDDKKNGLFKIFGEEGRIPDWKTYYRSYPLFQGHLKCKTEKHYYHVLTDKCMLIDIDTPRDLRWAEAVVSNGLFDFGF